LAADSFAGAVCPIPITRYPEVQLAHGGGGRLTDQLIEDLFIPAFGNPALGARHDGARLELGGARLAFSTDSYVVRPLFFPGSDIGALAVNGTVNDLAMCGARPKYLSCGFIIEEGLPMETLWRVVQSMRRAADVAGVTVVTGDTKVVDRGKGDGLYVNTAGVGLVEHARVIAPMSVRDGDVVIVSGDLGRHGMAVMAAREGLEFESAIESDCAPVAEPALALLAEGLAVHCMRDLTRGGLASAMVEIATASGLHLHLDERSIPVREDVRGACEVLGFDPCYVANEGRFVVILPAEDADRALAVLRGFDVSSGAVRIGTVDTTPAGLVTLRSSIGATRVMDMLSGEQLPRIC
jgi:hydrogenase expression/formation protein HypE